MPFINFSSASPFERNVIISSVKSCIKVASTHGGKVYGGFVRDFLVPFLKDSSHTSYFKDVDIWFTSQDSADAFVSDMGNLVVRFEGIDITENSYPGAFCRRQYYLKQFDTCLAWIDVIVSPTLPVNDFDVNEVTYSLDQDGKWQTSACPRLIKQIEDKRAVMLPSYCEIISKAKDIKCFNASYTKCKRHYENRINRIFISKGWKVLTPEILELPIEKSSSSGEDCAVPIQKSSSSGEDCEVLPNRYVSKVKVLRRE